MADVREYFIGARQIHKGEGIVGSLMPFALLGADGLSDTDRQRFFPGHDIVSFHRYEYTARLSLPDGVVILR